MRTSKLMNGILSVVFLAFFLGAFHSLYAKHIVHHRGYKNLPNNAFIFYPSRLQWIAVRNGQVIRSGRASGGRGYCPDIHRSCRTPTGTFSVTSMGGAGCVSTRYPVGRGGAKMPYCMFFTPLYAIHGSYDVPNYNASHGCIRVIPSDAKWLQRNFIRIGTTVIVRPY